MPESEIPPGLKDQIIDFLQTGRRFGKLEALRALLHEASPNSKMPIDLVHWVPIEMVSPNDYNPNSVAKVEMGLLYKSIDHDGYTQPVVTVLDKRARLYLPCGHSSSVEESGLWKVYYPLKASSDIPLELLTEKEASLSYTEKPLPGEKADTASKSRKRSLMTENDSVIGSESNGELDASIPKTDSAPSSSGTLPELTISSTFFDLACPTCLSKDSERKNSWSTYQAQVTDFGGGVGLRVSCLSSERRGQPLPPLTSLDGFGEALTGFAPSETSLESPPPNGTPAPVLRIINQTKAIIVDGFHRYFVMKSSPDIRERCNGMLPIVIIEKDINDRMASTVRHNRARGKHSVDGMANMVFSMLDNGMSDEEICNELGMEPEELLRLKHITGFSKLFADTKYNRAWVTKNQIRIRQKFKESQNANGENRA